MKYFMSIFLTVFSNTILFSQLVPSLQQKTSYSIMFFGAQHAFTKVGADSWASGGTGVVDQGASGAIFNNPACMNFQSLTLSAQVSERTRIKMLSLDYDGLFIPTQLSGGMKLNKWNLSVGYVNYFSYYSFSSMKETTPAHPEGTGRYFILGDDIKSHTFMGSANYTFDDISLGLTMAANYLNWDNSRYVYDDTHSGLGLIAIGGVLLKPSEKFNIGLSCKYASPIGWTDKGNYETYEYKTYFPWTMEAGGSIKLLSGLKVLTSIEFQNWKDVSKNMDNTVQFHLGGIIDISRFSNIRLGFFTQNDAYTALSEIMNQYFLTAGIQTGNENIMFHLSVLDSHLFKREESTLNKEFYQTIISLGGTYRFE